MVHTHYVPIYANMVMFTRSRREFAKTLAYYGCTAEDAGSDGITAILDNGGFLVGVFDKDPGTMAHEMAHVALSIIERVGFKAEDGQQEPFCYLLGHLVSHFSKVK